MSQAVCRGRSTTRLTHWLHSRGARQGVNLRRVLEDSGHRPRTDAALLRRERPEADVGLATPDFDPIAPIAGLILRFTVNPSPAVPESGIAVLGPLDWQPILRRSPSRHPTLLGGPSSDQCDRPHALRHAGAASTFLLKLFAESLQSDDRQNKHCHGNHAGASKRQTWNSRRKRHIAGSHYGLWLC
jgi:hypothetical protein